MKTALIVFAHGSTVESANQSVRNVVAEMAQLGDFQLVETAFLEGGRPDLAGAVDLLSNQGADRICVVPYFLTSGTHLKRDLPKLVDACKTAHPHLDFLVSPPLDGHPSLARILIDRAQATLDSSPTS